MEHDEILKRIEVLEDPWWKPQLIEQHYGIRMPDEKLMGRFRAWARNRRRALEVEQPGDQINRFALENYFQSSRWRPVKWAAAQLGMKPESFIEVLRQIVGRGLDTRGTIDTDDQLVDEVVLRDFRNYFPSFSKHVYLEHRTYCEELHEAIEKDLGVQVTPLWCVTSRLLGDEVPYYADKYDAITLEPVSSRWQVWLNFGKPINLAPDVCATKTYVEHEELLKPRLMSARPYEDELLAVRSKLPAS